MSTKEKMGGPLLTTLSMDNNLSTLLSMDSNLSSHDEMERELNRTINISQPPDINIPLSVEPSPPPPLWNDACNILDVSPGGVAEERDRFRISRNEEL